ncbi:MAG: hypothetical protein HOV94_13790 [Saccharothrix sp.]|nr:hypothetical protein [Saccharothrix sp.]
MLLHLKRIVAALLALAAVAVAVVPGSPPATLLVAARDLPPGVPLTPDDVRLITVPPSLSPAGAVSEADALGRALVSAARSGEPLTDARLTPVHPDVSSVAVRVADEGVTGLLRPGSLVDVVGEESHVLARDASVVAVREGEVVVLSTNRTEAHHLAATSLTGPVALIIH